QKSLVDTFHKSVKLYIRNGHQQKVEIALKALGDPTTSGKTEFRIAVAGVVLKHQLPHLHATSTFDTLRVMSTPKAPKALTLIQRALKGVQKALNI
ncbi:hypothetical protein DXG01_006949, partial [Tephrocybe rancida]